MSNVYVIQAPTAATTTATGITVEEVVRDSLQEIIVQAEEQPIEAVNMQMAIRYLNRMMAEFEAQGIALGYTIVDNAGDIVTVPMGAIGGIVTNLAVRLAGMFDFQVSGSLVQAASNGLKAMRMLGVEIEPTAFGGTLPVGSGNESDGYDNEKFYPDIDSTILTEDNGNILLESGT